MMRPACFARAALVCVCVWASGAAGAEDRLVFPAKPPYDEIGARYGARQVLAWPEIPVNGKSYRHSPALKAEEGFELNHHRVTVRFTGGGTVEVTLVHSAKDDVRSAGRVRSRRRPARRVRSGEEVLFTSPYRGERFGWVLLEAGSARIVEVRHVCWRGQGTLYGHVGRTFEFAGAKLPYRLMYPRQYDPRRKYPLVISVGGSGSVGTDNVRSMEMVTLARHLFTDHFHDKQSACFSLVPQIPPPQAVPEPYWPKGPKGALTRHHPDWPAVNENGWYVQATLALIQKLQQAEGLSIDPDRVYYTGFSYGGKGCWEFLKAGREVFAAAICGAGWPVGRAFSEPAGPMLERLRQEVRRYKHIPVHVFAGAKDPMRLGSAAVHREMLAAGGKSTYAEFPDTDHAHSAGKVWGDRKTIAWLLAQSRARNPKPGPDPYPGGVYESPSQPASAATAPAR